MEIYTAEKNLDTSLENIMLVTVATSKHCWFALEA